MGRRLVPTDLARGTGRRSIDAVEILTPTYLHHDHVVAALAAGKHVSCQKPLANSVADARDMAAAAAANGVILRVSECFCHYPPLELAKRLIADGAIGHPRRSASARWSGQTDSAFQAGLNADGYVWRLTESSPGGHLFDDMVHKYAMALWLFDQDIVSVQAAVRRTGPLLRAPRRHLRVRGPRPARHDGRSLLPRVMDMRSSYYGADEFFEIHGDEGFLWVTRSTGELLDLPPVMLYEGPPRTGFTDLDTEWGTGFRRSSSHFVERWSTAPATMTADDAIRVLQLCFAVYEAANESRPVDPRTIEDRVIPRGWPGGPAGLSRMKITRILHSSVNIGDGPTAEAGLAF